MIVYNQRQYSNSIETAFTPVNLFTESEKTDNMLDRYRSRYCNNDVNIKRSRIIEDKKNVKKI